MFKKIFLFLLLVHIFGDFYFQTDKLSRSKEKSFSGVITHSFIYSLCCLGLIIILTDQWVMSVAFVIALMHFIIDSIKYKYIKNCKSGNKYSKEKDSTVYALDQIIHIFTFAVISLIITRNYSSLNKLAIIDEIARLAGASSYQVFTWVFIILFIWKPANITIKKLLSSYRPSVNDIVDNSRANKEKIIRVKSVEALTDGYLEGVLTNDESKLSIVNDEKRAGGLIGFLERFIIVIFLAINQYSAIGLVLTAKSIARYDKIANDKVFAEYYLLGTLLSTLIVIISYFLIM